MDTPRSYPEPRRIDLLAGAESEVAGASRRPSLAVYFECANAYVRVFRNAEGTAYQARCPKCGRSMRFAVGSGGTDQRVFRVSC